MLNVKRSNKKIYPYEYLCGKTLLMASILVHADLQFYWNESQSQVFSCEICAILENIIIRKHCWASASDIQQHFGLAAYFITTCLGFSVKAIH